MTHNRQPLSAVLITLNEAHNLPRTLAALQGWVDDIVVVDSGSTDGTQALAEQHGARVIHRAFDGYGTQKQFAVSQAKHDWVLAMDADEVVTPALAAAITQSLQAPQAAGFRLQRTLVFLGRSFVASGEARRPILRLFDRRRGTYDASPVHEQVLLSGPVETLPGELLHYSYRDLDDYFRKWNRYTTDGAMKAFSGGKQAHVLTMFLRMPLAFLKVYVLRGGFRDGVPGLLWATFSAWAPVAKYAKLWALSRDKR